VKTYDRKAAIDEKRGDRDAHGSRDRDTDPRPARERAKKENIDEAPEDIEREQCEPPVNGFAGRRIPGEGLMSLLPPEDTVVEPLRPGARRRR
jgi:hypothetical protein